MKTNKLQDLAAKIRGSANPAAVTFLFNGIVSDGERIVSQYMSRDIAARRLKSAGFVEIRPGNFQLGS